MTFDLVADSEQNRPAAQRRPRLEALNAHKTPTLLSLQRRTLAELAADVRFACASHSAEVEILQRVAMIELKSGDVAFLYSQRRYRFKSNRLDTKRRGAREYVLPKRHSVIGRYIDFVRQLTREAEADEAQRDPRIISFRHPM